MLTNDNLVVVWESYYQDSDGCGVYAHLAQVLEHIEYFEDKRPKELLM